MAAGERGHGRNKRSAGNDGAENLDPELYQGPPWSDKQALTLVQAVQQFGENWMLVSEVVSKLPSLGPWRSREQCQARYLEYVTFPTAFGFAALAHLWCS